MKKPDEIKKGLEICLAFPTPKDGCNRCPYISERRPTGICRTSLKNDVIVLIQQHEANWQQVSKALCGKENATLEELLRAVDQVKQTKPGEKLICQINVDSEEILRKALDKTEVDGKTIAEWIELAKGYEQLKAELEAVKQERDAAVADLRSKRGCETCHNKEAKKACPIEDWFCHECLSDCPCVDCLQFSLWQWRGVCPENTEVKEDG